MVSWNQRMLPYPLLAPWSEDYADADFGMDIPRKPLLSANSEIRLALRLNNPSPTLRALAADKKARYVVIVSCADTFMSETFDVADEDVIVLNAGDYAEEILLRPYLVAAQALECFTAPEHAREWKLHRPQGFSVPRAGILAVGDGHEVALGSDDPESVIDLVADESIPDESFKVDTADERIKIYVSNEVKEKVEAIRRERATHRGFKALFPALYLHAVGEALRQLPDAGSARWTRVMRRALDNAGLGDIDAETISERSLEYAQKLMGNPLGDFLAVMVSPDAHDEEQE